MSLHEPQRRASDGTRARIVEALRRGPLTVEDLAREVGITRTAIRAQLTSLLSEGLIEPRESRRGPSKPSRTYGITDAAKLRLSRAYVPILVEMFEVLSRKKSPEELVELMREVGRQLARTYPRSHGTVRERMTRASQLLRELGGLTEVIEEEGKVVILGHGCPLAAATRTHPEACNIIESLLSQVVGEPVSKCCDRYARERCCFEIAAGAA